MINSILHKDFEAALTVNGEPRKIAIAIKGENMDEPTWTSKLFHDSAREINGISNDLDRSRFFQLSWEDVNDNLVSVSCNTNCAAIVVAWEHSSRQDNIIALLKDQDWILKNEQEVSWKNWEWTYVYGKSKAILAKKIGGGSTLSFSRPANDLPLSVFVIPGMKEW